MLNVGFIGNGKSTNRYHLPFILKTKKFNVKTIYAPSSNRVWKKLADVSYTNRIEDVLEDTDLDLVIITTPSGFHYHYAKLALEHGQNVLLEKPFTLTSLEAKELFQLAHQRGLFLQAYQNRRLDSDFLTVQKVIESGKLGEVLEVEMHYDYFRPEVPESVEQFSLGTSYLYNHACHTVDQVLSYFGNPDQIHYDVRQLLGKGRMNDYFDLDFYYTNGSKISIKSSYFRIKPRPSFIVYGKKGMFIKESKDRQEEDLKHFYMPNNPDFGLDSPEHYGTLTYMDEVGCYHEEKVISELGDYSQFYEKVYASLVHGAEKFVTDEQTIRLMEILEEGISGLK